MESACLRRAGTCAAAGAAVHAQRLTLVPTAEPTHPGHVDMAIYGFKAASAIALRWAD